LLNNGLENIPHIFAYGHKIINVPDSVKIKSELMEETVPQGVLLRNCHVEQEMFEILHFD
jgi:hypothetical protein